MSIRATPRTSSALAGGPMVSIVSATFGRFASAETFGAVGAVHTTTTSGAVPQKPDRDNAWVAVAAVVCQSRRVRRAQELLSAGILEIINRSHDGPSSSILRPVGLTGCGT